MVRDMPGVSWGQLSQLCNLSLLFAFSVSFLVGVRSWKGPDEVKKWLSKNKNNSILSTRFSGQISRPASYKLLWTKLTLPQGKPEHYLTLSTSLALVFHGPHLFSKYPPSCSAVAFSVDCSVGICSVMVPQELQRDNLLHSSLLHGFLQCLKHFFLLWLWCFLCCFSLCFFFWWHCLKLFSQRCQQFGWSAQLYPAGHLEASVSSMGQSWCLLRDQAVDSHCQHLVTSIQYTFLS